MLLPGHRHNMNTDSQFIAVARNQHGAEPTRHLSGRRGRSEQLLALQLDLPPADGHLLDSCHGVKARLGNHLLQHLHQHSLDRSLDNRCMLLSRSVIGGSRHRADAAYRHHQNRLCRPQQAAPGGTIGHWGIRAGRGAPCAEAPASYGGQGRLGPLQHQICCSGLVHVAAGDAAGGKLEAGGGVRIASLISVPSI
jgi:hypothetical protein